ncbi:MAG: hypothetical protein KJZ86_24890 [Caldilineaceae bacterium]|nr:hypothetical protein [Caldilineaceae bacterium]HRJ40874.1 hypothetical protein [Caldilineaceae bacterium]
MNTEETVIDRSMLPESFRKAEGQKSNLILEGNFLHLQKDYAAAADRFALAAELESALAEQLVKMGNWAKAFSHSFSAISCWGRAGDLHRALLLGEELLRVEKLSQSQRQQVTEYLDSLRSRMILWMHQWDTTPMQSAD